MSLSKELQQWRWPRTKEHEYWALHVRFHRLKSQVINSFIILTYNLATPEGILRLLQDTNGHFLWQKRLSTKVLHSRAGFSDSANLGLDITLQVVNAEDKENCDQAIFCGIWRATFTYGKNLKF